MLKTGTGSTVGRTLVIVFLITSSFAFISIMPESRADPIEHTYFLHAESTSGIGTYLDLMLTNPEPNSTIISEDVGTVKHYQLGEGWIQNENHDYFRDVSGTWTFTMYVYCDDNIIDGRLYAKVFDGFNNRINSVSNRSELIGPCADPSNPREIVWDDVMDEAEASAFVQGERVRLEIWFDATSGGTTGGERLVTSEGTHVGQTISGSYLDTQAGNEGGIQYQQLREEAIPCGPSTLFEVVGENGVEGQSISGDYNSLALNDETNESIGESGNPNSLEWIWNIDIAPGTGQYSFYIDALIGQVPFNDDNFTIEYSTTGAFAGEEVPMFNVNGSWIKSYSDPPPARYDFPGGVLTGVNTVYIRATDTNLNDWPQHVDVLNIDRMYIELVEQTSNCSALDHVWVIDNIPDAGINEFYVNAHHSTSLDGDDFRFSYSIESSLGHFQNLFIIQNTTDEDYYYTSSVGSLYDIPTLWLRVEDTDRTPDPSPQLDDLFIDHIYMYTSGGGTPYQLHLIVDNSTYPSRIQTIEDVAGDTAKPTSVVLALPPYSDAVFPIGFIASDIGSGVHHVELWYVLSDDIPIQYPGSFTTSPITFVAPVDGRYRFYTRAVDNALNYEDPPATFDAATTVDLSAPTVTDVDPDNTETNVPREIKIVIRFSESMNSRSVNDAFELVEEDGRSWFASEGNVVWNHPMNNTFTFTLAGGERLNWDTKYTIIVGTGAQDLAGRFMANRFESTFTTESEFNPAMLLLIIVIAVVIMLAILAYFMFLKKKPEEEEKIEEAVQVQPEQIPVQPPQAAPPPPVTYAPPPPPVQQPPPGPQPLWQSEKPVEEMWKEDRAKTSACTNCGRFILDTSTFCPYCGVKRK